MFARVPIFASAGLRAVSTTSTAKVATATLSNGVKVAAYPKSGPLASVGVTIGVGSSAAPAGMAALLSSAVFSGTDKRSNVLQVRKLEHTGASVDARVTRDSVTISAQVLGDSTGEILELIADGLNNCAFDAHDVQDGVTALSAAPVSHEQAAADALFGAAYRFQGYGAPLVFPSDASPAAQDVADFAASAVSPNNILVTGVGMELDDLVAISENAFGSMNAAEDAAPVAAADAPYTGGEVVSFTPNPEHGHGIIAFPAPGRGSDKFHAAAVAAQLLGEDSPFFVNNAASLIGVYFDGSDAESAVAAAKDAAKNAAANLDAAKSRAKAAFLMSFDNGANAVAHISDAISAGANATSPADVVAAIDAVKAADVNAVFKDAFAQPPTMLAVSNALPSYPALLKSL